MRTEPAQGPLLSLFLPKLGSSLARNSWEAEGREPQIQSPQVGLDTEQDAWPP